jgi:hypothetical protein
MGLSSTKLAWKEILNYLVKKTLSKTFEFLSNIVPSFLQRISAAQRSAASLERCSRAFCSESLASLMQEPLGSNAASLERST